MSFNEKTSERVASIASRIMKMQNPGIENYLWEDIRSLAASALTQTPDKPKDTFMDINPAIFTAMLKITDKK